jgi:hypothetical protein
MAGEFVILDKLLDFLSSEPATKKEFLACDLRVRVCQRTRVN